MTEWLFAPPSPLMAGLIEAWTLTARALALCVGLFVMQDYFKVRMGVEVPPHSSKRNGAAWAVVAFGAALGAGVLLLTETYDYGPKSPLLVRLTVLLIWLAIAIGLKMRSVARLPRPHLAYYSASFFMLVGGFLTFRSIAA